MPSMRCLLFLFLLVLAYLTPTLRCAPFPGRRSSNNNRDSLIMGTDFLSLFMRQEQKVTTPMSTETTTDTSTTTEVTVAVTQPHVKVSVHVSSSMSSAATTTTPDIFTTFLKAFSEPSPSPSAVIRSPSLTVEEPVYGTRLSRRRQLSSGDNSKSASEQITVRFSPKTTSISPVQEIGDSPIKSIIKSDTSKPLYDQNDTLQSNEKIYAENEKNYIKEMKYTDNIKTYNTQPEKLYGKQENAEQSYGQQNNEVPVSATTQQQIEGLQVFDKTLDAERVAASQKFGYVVEGHNYRKYRVEERTPDGFIVGEYGVVSHDDGQLRGVRYTADSTINPKLIYEALMNFLKL